LDEQAIDNAKEVQIGRLLDIQNHDAECALCRLFASLENVALPTPLPNAVVQTEFRHSAARPVIFIHSCGYPDHDFSRNMEPTSIPSHVCGVTGDSL
jgi:hypothetical protein